MSNNISRNQTNTNTTFSLVSDTKISLTEVLVIAGNKIVSFMILTNNSLLLITFAKTRKLWTQPNAYIATLSIADLLVGLMLVVRNFWVFPQTRSVFENNKFACLPVTCILYISALESLGCLVLMSADRYFYIVHPFWYESNMTPSVTLRLIITSWCVSACLGVLPMWLNDFSPVIGCNPMIIISKYYLLCCLCVYFIAAATTLVFLYGRIFCVGNRQIRNIQVSTVGAPSQNKKHSSNWQVIRFILLVCGLFFVCWMPLLITVICYFTSGAHDLAVSVTVSIAALNSSLNFYVLLSMNKTFKWALIRTLCPSNRVLAKINGAVVSPSHFVSTF